MFEMNAEIVNETGLHARPATLFLKEAAKYKSKITIIKGDKEANAKSMLNILSLALNKGTKITLRAEGEDEKAAVENLAGFISNLRE